MKPFYPLEKEQVDLSKRYRDELVIFQDAQALPLFLIYYDQNQSIDQFIIEEGEKTPRTPGLFCKFSSSFLEPQLLSKEIFKIIEDHPSTIRFQIDFTQISMEKRFEILKIYSNSDRFCKIGTDDIGNITGFASVQEARVLKAALQQILASVVLRWWSDDIGSIPLLPLLGLFLGKSSFLRP